MSERVILVTSVGAAAGSKAAAAALACAASSPDCPGLLVDVGGRPPRPTLVASSGARQLEERLAAHLPGLRAASRGQTCHLAVESGPEAFEQMRAALPLVRDSVAAVHLPPALFRDAMKASGVEPSGVLLRADLGSDRALVALAARDLLGNGLVVKILKRGLGWIPARRALFGVLPATAADGLSAPLLSSLLESQIPAEHLCYGDVDDAKADAAGTAQRQRRGDARPRWGGGLHRDAKRAAGR